MLISQFDRTPARKSTLVTKGSGVSMRVKNDTEVSSESDLGSTPILRGVRRVYGSAVAIDVADLVKLTTPSMTESH
jgi:hypothetical protein